MLPVGFCCFTILLSFLILHVFAETFGTERRPIVEFALEDVEKMRLQRIRNERNERAKEAAQEQRRAGGDQSATDGPRPNNKRPFGKGRKQESHDIPSKPSESSKLRPDDLHSAADPKSTGSTPGDKRQPQRPAKRARQSNKGAVVSDGNQADAAPNAVATQKPSAAHEQADKRRKRRNTNDGQPEQKRGKATKRARKEPGAHAQGGVDKSLAEQYRSKFLQHGVNKTKES